jgi:hypothetical protein
MLYESIATQQDFHDSHENENPKVVWHKDRSHAMRLWLDHDPVNSEIEEFASYLFRYSMLPAINDNFNHDTKRHEWLNAQPDFMQKFYEFNRLRVNNISTVLMSIFPIANNLRSVNEDSANLIEEIGKEAWKRFKEEDRSKMSMDFSDYLVEKSIEVLQILSSH